MENIFFYEFDNAEDLNDFVDYVFMTTYEYEYNEGA